MEGTAPSSGSETTGPATFADASLWSDASSASTAQPTITEAEQPASATASPAPTITDGTTPATGEPPQERWPDILSNARTKAAEEKLRELGLDRFDTAHLKTVAPYLQRAMQDAKGFLVSELTEYANPIEVLQEAISKLQSHPVHGQALRSLAARALATRAQPQGPDLTPIPVQLEDGRTVSLFSADQIGAMKAQWLDEAKQSFQPVAQTLEQLQADRATAQQQAANVQFAAKTTADVKGWPGVTDESMKAMAIDIQNDPNLPENPTDEQMLLAVNAAYRRHVLPTYSQNAEAKLLDKLKTKAAAATSVNPGSAAPSAPRPVKSFHDLGPEMWR